MSGGGSTGLFREDPGVWVRASKQIAVDGIPKKTVTPRVNSGAVPQKG